MPQLPASRENTDAVRMERSGAHVALVILNRPATRNAINAAVACALEAAVDATEADPDIRAVVLTASGDDVFCAGADLKEIAAGRRDDLRTVRGGFAGFVYRERTKPWIAAINGKALAGGMEIALACDLIVAADHAEFGLPEVMRGLIAAAGGLYRLPRAIPPNIALELVLTAGTLDAGRAHQLGLVNRLATRTTLRNAALGLAAEIARNAPLAVLESLKIVRKAGDLEEGQLRALVLEAMDRLASSKDLREGLHAFIEKRLPVWTGH